ncbi:MAG TPA: hypothetical protein VL098_08560 [Flavipsychrobacter sp.]|nr:hypothetical protein [Flavipsychrobacter sp.]
MRKKFRLQPAFIAMLLLFAAYFTFNQRSIATPYPALEWEDSLVVIYDSSINVDDSVHVPIDTIEIDSICYELRYGGDGGDFKIFARINGLAPAYAWVNFGAAWYGPIPNTFVALPNTHIYTSPWFDQIIAGNLGLGCLQIKFTLNANFNSTPYVIRTVCPCGVGIE